MKESVIGKSGTAASNGTGWAMDTSKLQQQRWQILGVLRPNLAEQAVERLRLLGHWHRQHDVSKIAFL
jgi:hypothetical protein